MNDRDLGQSLGDWMRDSRSGASPWVLDSVIEHARLHTNQRWWRRRPRHARTRCCQACRRAALRATCAGRFGDRLRALSADPLLFVPGFAPQLERHPATASRYGARGSRAIAFDPATGK